MSQREDPRAFIANRDLFGGLADHDPLRHRVPVRPNLAAPARGTGDAAVAGLMATGSPGCHPRYASSRRSQTSLMEGKRRGGVPEPTKGDLAGRGDGGLMDQLLDAGPTNVTPSR